MSNEDLHDLYLNTLHELNHEKLRREGFEKDVEMHKKMTNLLADRTAGVIVERDRLKAEVERLTNLKSGADCFKADVDHVTKAKLDDARTVIDDLHVIAGTSNAEELIEFVKRAADTIGAQGVELDDLRARLRT